MKILVFDDNATHRNAAKAQLKGHDLTVVGTYDEAQKALSAECNYEKATLATNALFPNFDPHRSTDEEKKKAYWAAKEEQRKLATTFPDFDVVLTDLLVPASSQAQGSDSYSLVGKEMPVGIFIGLLAAVRTKAKFVAVFTDSDHHSHPASACMDPFNAGECNPTPFLVKDCRVLLSNTRNWVDHFDHSDLATMVDIYKDLPSNVSPSQRQREWLKEGKIVRAKNWVALLDYLLKTKL